MLIHYRQLPVKEIMKARLHLTTISSQSTHRERCAFTTQNWFKAPVLNSQRLVTKPRNVKSFRLGVILVFDFSG